MCRSGMVAVVCRYGQCSNVVTDCHSWDTTQGSVFCRQWDAPRGADLGVGDGAGPSVKCGCVCGCMHPCVRASVCWSLQQQACTGIGLVGVLACRRGLKLIVVAASCAMPLSGLGFSLGLGARRAQVRVSNPGVATRAVNMVASSSDPIIGWGAWQGVTI